MVDAPSPVGQPLPAGDFSEWLGEVTAAISGERASKVPCGTCTACCMASQFIHIGPDEVDTLAHIRASLLFPAPRLPKGHVLLGYDQNGHCPMLVDNACSIYEHRPQTCRAYDCRIFAATGLEPAEPAKALIAQQARRWEFSYPTPDDVSDQAAVQAAAAFIGEHPEQLPAEVVPHTATQHALLALERRDDFR